MNSKYITNINSLVLLLSSLFVCGSNSVYKAYDIACRIVQSAAKERSLEAMHKLTKYLSADRVLERLHTLSKEDIRSLVKPSLKGVKFPRKVKLAIDFTDKQYYGNKNHPEVMGSKGGKYVRKYIEVSTVSPPLFIDSLSVDQLTHNKVDLITQLIDGFYAAFPKIGIELLLLDRGFFAKEVVGYLMLQRIKFIMPAVKHKPIKELAKLFEKGKIPEKIKYKFGDYYVNLVFIKFDKEVYVYMTNTNKGSAETAWLYRRRWQIETNFREQNNFLLKTKTTNFTIRYLTFVISGLLFNLWQLARRIVPYTLESYIFKQYLFDELLTIWQQQSGVVVKTLQFYLPA